MSGRAFRALLRPFSARHHGRLERPPTKLFTEISEAIPWCLAQLMGAKQRTASTRAIRPVLVRADACGEGDVGVVVVVAGMATAHHTQFPPWFGWAKTGIFELGLVGGVLGLIVAGFRAPGRPVVL